jgi:hypothetical protein
MLWLQSEKFAAGCGGSAALLELAEPEPLGGDAETLSVVVPLPATVEPVQAAARRASAARTQARVL